MGQDWDLWGQGSARGQGHLASSTRPFSISQSLGQQAGGEAATREKKKAERWVSNTLNPLRRGR